MRAGEKERLGVIRMITSAIKQREVDERISLDDAQVLSVLEKMIKQRKESLVQFQAGNRQDLVDKESAEIALLQSYLPSQLERCGDRCPDRARPSPPPAPPASRTWARSWASSRQRRRAGPTWPRSGAKIKAKLGG